jgi:hypothetical protein
MATVGGQGNAFIGGAEQAVEGQAGGGDGVRVEFAEFFQRQAVVEQAGIEEIRAHAPGLGLELAEQQHLLGNGEIEEFTLETCTLNPLHPCASSA